jgi:SnoaL-like polyketide cyclase
MVSVGVTAVRRPGVVVQDVAARASVGSAGRAVPALIERNAADRCLTHPAGCSTLSFDRYGRPRCPRAAGYDLTVCQQRCTVAEAEALTRKIVEIFDTGAFDLIPSLIAPEYVDHQGLGEKEIRGPDGFRQVVEAVRRDEGVHVTVEDLVADEERAAVRLRWYGVNQAGVVVTRETLDMLRFANGRLVEHWGSQLFRQEQ